MENSKLLLGLFCILLINSCATKEEIMAKEKDIKDIYSFSADSIDGEQIQLNKYQGKVLLIVNTASHCGFTPQYAGLQKLYDKYKDQGFIVLGFPCNQFGSQEPGDNKNIRNFCQLNYGVTFPMFAKINVNGDKAHPLFQYLRETKSGLLGNNIKWNFTKFLINKQGVPVERYASITSPEKIEKEIEKLLGE